MGLKAKVFLIDDDKIVLKALSKLFRPYDVEVMTFLDPVKALEEMPEHKPEIVFLDYNMPLLNGMQVIVKVSEIKMFTHSALYLLSSSDFNEMETIKLKTLGFYDIFSKPLSTTTIEQVLECHLGQVPKKAA